MTDSYRMSDMCAMCGERYGQHVGLSCCNSRGSFFLAAKPANGPESYHYRAGLNDYFTRAAEQANRLVFPSGAAVLTSGDKIVGRVEAELSEWDNVKPGAIINIRKPAQYITRTDTATYAAPSGNRLMTAADIRAAIDAALAATFSAPASTPIAPAIAPEPIRPALDWNTATPFDPFKDFEVKCGEFNEYETDMHPGSGHPLQRMNKGL